MNKKLSQLFICLTLIFCFVFAGCNSKPKGQLDISANANLGSPESYTMATSEQQQFLTDYITADNFSSDVENYKLTVILSGGDITIASMNGIVQPTQNGFNLGLKISTSVGSIESAGTIFIKNKVVAIGFEGGFKTQAELAGMFSKFKTTLPESISEETVEGVDVFTTYNLDFVVASLKELDFNTQNINVKTSVEGDITRFEIVQIIEDLGFPIESKTYLVFKNNKLIQCKNNGSLMGLEHEIIIEKTNENIEFPNFDEYAELSYDKFLANSQIGG
ncbi:MAG: hypothetical protein IJD48_01850 [Clostridia bacterium]|nr:hypothetical protein [Clostridia bacterium]